LSQFGGSLPGVVGTEAAGVTDGLAAEAVGGTIAVGIDVVVGAAEETSDADDATTEIARG